MTGRIVTTTYRYKPPPRKRTPVALDGPAIVRNRGRANAVVPSDRIETPTPDRKPAIITVRRLGKADVPGMTPAEHHQRRGDTAEALWRDLVAAATVRHA